METCKGCSQGGTTLYNLHHQIARLPTKQHKLRAWGWYWGLKPRHAHGHRHQQHSDATAEQRRKSPSSPWSGEDWCLYREVPTIHPHTTNRTTKFKWVEFLTGATWKPNLHWWRWSALPLLINCQTWWLLLVCSATSCLLNSRREGRCSVCLGIGEWQRAVIVLRVKQGHLF